MCGLLSMITTENLGFATFDKDEFKQMLVVNSFRGAHSTGIAGIERGSDDPKVNLVRSVGNPYQLYNYMQTDQFFNRMLANFDTIIGHGRYATRGAINAENAHPFIEDHITLAHNGVISNYQYLRNHTTHKHIEVDSQLIAKLIAEEGADAVLPRIEGAYVLIWYNALDKTFNIARNKERPLFVAEQTGKKTLTFASEEQTLVWNSTRNNTPYNEIKEIPVMQHHIYYPDSLIPEIREYKQKEKPVYYGGHTGYNRAYWDSWEDETFPANNDNSVVVNVDWKNKSRKMRDIATEGDDLALELMKDKGKLNLGMRAAFLLDDIKDQAGYYLVTGYSEVFPNVLFRTTFLPADGISEDDIINCLWLEGTVRSISPIQDADKSEYSWQVFIGDAELITEENETTGSQDDETEEERVQLFDVMGNQRSMTKFRFVELSKHPCSWCNAPIPALDLKNPSKMMVFDVDDKQEELVCAHCAEDTLVTLLKH